MTLIKSVSGIRGTIGGPSGENLTPPDIVGFAAAYGTWLKESNPEVKVVIGRDGRRSGAHVQGLVMETLLACGVDVIDVGLSTTPAVEMYVPKVNAQGGIIITASHNPAQWNALKFLNAEGEFISKKEGESIIQAVDDKHFDFVSLDEIGNYTEVGDAINYHNEAICALDLVDVASIRRKEFHVVVDCINSTAALAIPPLLDTLGCTYTLLNDDVSGKFAHNPEPLAAHLTDLMEAVPHENAALGIAVDPDVDRLAFVSEDGSYFGEEYTLVAIADYILSGTPGNTVSNLSSTKALRDVTEKYGGDYTASPVGEVHVVSAMKDAGAVIGGEGNGGVIYPPLHYGRDAPVGIALMLSHLSKSGKSMTELRAAYPQYFIAKSKIQLADVDPDSALNTVREHYRQHEIDTRDGVKILLDNGWIHLRKSNTEPILRLYVEQPNEQLALALTDVVKKIAS
jgi:phosphomannomutase